MMNLIAKSGFAALALTAVIALSVTGPAIAAEHTPMVETAKH